MDIRQVADSERDIWNKFIADDPTGDLLQSYEWGEIKRISSGWNPIRLMVFDNERPLAAASVLERRLPKVGKSILYAPRGPVGDFSNTKLMKRLAQAAKECSSKAPILLKMDPPVPVEEGDTDANFLASGFCAVGDAAGFGGTQPKCVMQLNLEKDADALLADFKPKTRYNIRLAEKKGVTIREGEGKADLRRFYDLLLETAKRDRFLVRGYSYYETLWDVLAPEKLGRLFLGEYNGEAVCGAFCFYMGDRCWYTYGASSNSHRNVMPNYLMQWHMILHAKSIGCRLYDFRGVSPRKEADPDDHLQGLNRFKEGFAAHYVEYIGEYDLPYSRPMYWLWTAAAPRAMALMKGRKRSAKASQPDV